MVWRSMGRRRKRRGEEGKKKNSEGDFHSDESFRKEISKKVLPTYLRFRQNGMHKISPYSRNRDAFKHIHNYFLDVLAHNPSGTAHPRRIPA